MRKLIYFLATLLLAAVSCKKEVALPMQIINPDTESITAPAFGADYEINVVSNTAWELDAIGENWLSSAFEDAVGNSGFTLTVSANEAEHKDYPAPGERGRAAACFRREGYGEEGGFLSVPDREHSRIRLHRP